MIARKNRFKGHASVSRVRGKSARSAHLTAFYMRAHKRDDYRMAVVVSKKTAKSAVVRNRIRRRLYEIARKDRLFVNQPIDVVLVVKSDEVAKLPHDALQLEMATLRERIIDSM